VNFTGNHSPGALDNGSGVGTLLELARSWRPRAGAPAEVVWVATGSEEVALDGARHFLRLHESWWKEKPTLLINLESVGAGSRVYLAGEARALRLARQAAQDLQLAHARLRVLGAGMDHQPFAARGLAAVSVLGDVVRNAFAMHTPRDDMSLIQLDALERAGTLAAHLAWSWAEMHQPQDATGAADSEQPLAAHG
jgi:Zn-dependent M28 family amino/carboxypeptidase